MYFVAPNPSLSDFFLLANHVVLMFDQMNDHYTFIGIQMVKNPPAIQETWVPCRDQADPLKKGTATHSSILDWRIPWTTWWAAVHGSQRVGHD